MSDQALFLLVEDNEDHVLLIRRAFVKSKVLNPLQGVRKGEDAIAYLEGTGRFANRAEFPLPAGFPPCLNLSGIYACKVPSWSYPNTALVGVVAGRGTSTHMKPRLH